MEQAVKKYVEAIAKCLEWQNEILHLDNTYFDSVKERVWEEVLNEKFDLDCYLELADLFREDAVKFADDSELIFERIALRMQDLSNLFISEGLRHFNEVEINRHLGSNVDFLNSLINQSFRGYHYQMLYRNFRFNHNEHIERIERERNEIAAKMQSEKSEREALQPQFNAINTQLEFLHHLRSLVYEYERQVSYTKLRPYIGRIRESKQINRFEIAAMIFHRLHEIQETFETQVFKVEENTAVSPNSLQPIQQRIISHYTELAFKIDGNSIVGVRGFNSTREGKVFKSELLELYELPANFNFPAYILQLKDAIQKEKEYFNLAKDWRADLELYSVQKLPLNPGEFQVYFKAELRRIYHRYLFAERLKISNWRELETKNISVDFIKQFTVVLAEKRNFLLAVLKQLELLAGGELELVGDTAVDVDKLDSKDDEGENDFELSTIHDFLEPFKGKMPRDYDRLCGALKEYFVNGQFPNVAPIQVARINKKSLARALKHIYRALRPVDSLKVDYLLFAKEKISCFSGDEIDIADFTKSNLYKYFTHKQ